MNFAFPWALFLLILLLPLVGLMVFDFRQKKRILSGFLSRTAASVNVVRSGREIDFFKALLMAAALAFFILALAGPQWGERYSTIELRGLPVYFLLDTSTSMAAEDVKPNRLEAAKNLIRTLAAELPSDMIGLANFAALAYVQCPLTLDREAFALLTGASALSPADAQGTDFGQALAVAARSLKDLRASRKLVVLVTDGEDQEGTWKKALAELKKGAVVVYTVGVGVRNGGSPIPIKDEQGRVRDWKKDRMGKRVRTVLDERTLEEIATRGGGRFFRLSDGSGSGAIVQALKSVVRGILAQRVRREKIARFQYPLLLGLFLLGMEMVLSERRWPWAKK